MVSRRAKEDKASADDTIRVLDLYQTRDKIVVRKLDGFFQRLKRYTGLPMLAAFLTLPWLQFDGRQIVWFDLPARKFYVFNITFWPQDFMLLAWALIISAFALFTVTVMVGRVWCGFSCPQTVWTWLFMGAENIWEGDRNARIKLDKAPLSWNKLWRKSMKQASWVLIALVTGLTFVGYFNPIRDLVPSFFTLSAHPAALFWTLFFTVMTYMNAAYLREQVCLYMCPYARFQSVMFDADTLIVSYDQERGEPRGTRKKSTDYRSEGKGDCVDCSLCVQVCPTGIDIRDGLQYECISCGLCIDACDAVMEKMNYQPKLIQFTAGNKLVHKKEHFLRPRLLAYLVALLVMIGLFAQTIYSRVPLELDVIRDRNVLYRQVENGLVENTYTLRINNMDNYAHHYRISTRSQLDFDYRGQREVKVDKGEVLTLVVRLAIDPGLLKLPSEEVIFEIESIDTAGLTESQKSRFIGPRLF